MIITVVELILMFVFSIRMQGSAALNICSVASGAADFYYEYGIHVWDIAAAGIIAEEAGATLVDPSGKNSTLIWIICVMHRIIINHNEVKVECGILLFRTFSVFLFNQMFDPVYDFIHKRL